jgi:hypothetical protein
MMKFLMKVIKRIITRDATLAKVAICKMRCFIWGTEKLERAGPFLGKKENEISGFGRCRSVETFLHTEACRISSHARHGHSG